MIASCIISRIPDLCAGAVINSSGYVSVDAQYNIGRLNTIMATYNPSNEQLSSYGYSRDAVANSWTPFIYTINSRGMITEITSGGITSGGATLSTPALCVENGYNTKNDSYSLISWYPVAYRVMIPSENGGGICSNGKLTPGPGGQGITAPGNIVKTYPQTAAIGATGAASHRGGGGGSPEPPEPPSCDVFIGVVTNAPAGGFGAGTVKKVRFNADGSWSETGQTVSVIFPRI